jgi:DNA-binding transcriptional regulator YiaG
MLPNAISHNQEPAYIRQLLEKSRLSQRQFAKTVGVNERTVRMWVASPCIPYTAQYCLEVLANEI